MSEHIYDPILNYVFGAFCLVLLGFLFWVMKRVFTLFDENSRIVEKSTDALATNTEVTRQNVEATEKMCEAVNKMHTAIQVCSKS